MRFWLRWPTRDIPLRRLESAPACGHWLDHGQEAILTPPWNGIEIVPAIAVTTSTLTNSLCMAYPFSWHRIRVRARQQYCYMRKASLRSFNSLLRFAFSVRPPALNESDDCPDFVVRERSIELRHVGLIARPRKLS